MLPLWFVAFGLGMAGCSDTGDNLPREAITGSVTLDGQPLNGAIQFTPSSNASGGVAVGGGSPIVDGTYSVAREQGLVPGKYKVAINAASAPASSSAGKSGDPGRAPSAIRPKELVPAKYNSATTLEAEVKEGGSNRFDFKLESK
jgi:hypothetical protein